MIFSKKLKKIYSAVLSLAVIVAFNGVNPVCAKEISALTVAASVAANAAMASTDATNAKTTEDTDADPDEIYQQGAGVELVIGATDDMTMQDFLDMMEDLTINEEEEKLANYNWGYSSLGIANVDEALNIRMTPSTSSDKVGELPADAACEILEVVGEWTHIKSGLVEGYVYSQYLITGNDAKARAEEVETLTATVLAQNLKVRKQPDTNHGTWALVSNGTKLEVIEVLDNGWVQVVYGTDGEDCYVSGDYVEVNYELDTALTMNEVKYGKGVTDAGLDLAQRAIQYVGNPYVYGGTSLTNGTDCSGFTMLLMRKYGISLSHSARAQANCGTPVSLNELRPGDLVFYGTGSTVGSINHVTIYIGGGQVCHASNPTKGIIITGINYRTPVCARRFF